MKFNDCVHLKKIILNQSKPLYNRRKTVKQKVLKTSVLHSR